MDQPSCSRDYHSDSSAHSTDISSDEYQFEEESSDDNYRSSSSDEENEDNLDLDITRNPWFRIYPPEDEDNDSHVFEELTGPKHMPARNAPVLDYFMLFF